MKFKSIKLWLNIVTVVALVLLIFFSRHQVNEAFEKFADLNFFWLVLIIPLQIGNHFSVAKFYQNYLTTLGEKLQIKDLFKVSLEMNFVNNVFPSGGFSGFGYFGLRMKKLGVPGSKSTLTQMTRHALTFISFIFYLVFALLFLALFGNASRLMVLISSSIISLVVVTAVVMVYIISDELRIKAFTAFLPKAVNSIVDYFRKGRRPTINIQRIEQLFGDLHRDYLEVKHNWRKLKRPFMWTMLMNLTELSTIFVVYLSFGQLINPGALIIAYAVANVAGLLSVLPSGVGVYEGLMTAVLASSGVPKAIALSATLVYRVLNMAIFLPIGFVFYQIALRHKTEETG